MTLLENVVILSLGVFSDIGLKRSASATLLSDYVCVLCPLPPDSHYGSSTSHPAS